MTSARFRYFFVIFIMVFCFVASFLLSFRNFTGYVVSDNYLSVSNLGGILFFLAGIGVALYFFKTTKRFI